MKSTRTRLPGITLRDATASDADDVVRLLTAVNPDDPELYEAVRPDLGTPHVGPLSHFRTLVVLAEDGTGRPVGALLAGIPLWLLSHPATSHRVLQADLIARIGTITAVAVDPRHRGRGVGAELMRHAVRRFTRAGYGMLTLNCYPALEEYYQRLGFTIMDDLIVHLPDGRMAAPLWDDTRVGVKALDRHTALASVPGLGSPVVSGILRGSRVADGAYFDGTRLCN